MKTIKQVFILVGIAIALAGGVNLIHPRRIPWVEDWEHRVETMAVKEGVALTQLSELLEFLRADSHRIVDARPAEQYHRAHIPGAWSVPFDSSDVSILDEESKPIVVYCSGPECDDSVLLALDLLKAGRESVSVFIGGMELWRSELLSAEGDER